MVDAASVCDDIVSELSMSRDMLAVVHSLVIVNEEMNEKRREDLFIKYQVRSWTVHP